MTLLLGVDYFRHSSCYFFSELHVTNFDTTHDAMHYAITHFVEGLVHGFLYNICWLDDIFLEKHGADFVFLIAIPFPIFLVLRPWVYNQWH